MIVNKEKPELLYEVINQNLDLNLYEFYIYKNKGLIIKLKDDSRKTISLLFTNIHEKNSNGKMFSHTYNMYDYDDTNNIFKNLFSKGSNCEYNLSSSKLTQFNHDLGISDLDNELYYHEVRKILMYRKRYYIIPHFTCEPYYTNISEYRQLYTILIKLLFTKLKTA